jgi:hypothetical protein
MLVTKAVHALTALQSTCVSCKYLMELDKTKLYAKTTKAYI